MAAPELAADLDDPAVATRTGAGAYRWYVLILLTAAYAIHAIDRTVVNILVEPIKREFGVSDSALGFMTGLAYAIPFALAGLPLGVLADRTRRQRLLAILLATWSAMTALGGVCHSFLALLITRGAVGAAESGSPPTALALVSDYFPPRLRAFATSVFYVGAPIGAIAGFYFTAVITAAHGWRVALFAAGAPGVVVAMLILLTVREPARGGLDLVKAVSNPPFAAVLRMIVRDHALTLIVAALVMGSMASVGIGAWMQALLLRAYHMPMVRVGGLAGLAGLFGAAGTFMGGVLANSLAKGRTERLLLICGVSALAAAPFTLMFLLGSTHPLNLVAYFGSAALTPLYYGPGFSLALSMAPAQMRGRMMALTLVLCNILGAGLGPQIIGLLSDLLASRHDALALPHAASFLVVGAVLTGLLFLLAIAFARPGLTQPIDITEGEMEARS